MKSTTYQSARSYFNERSIRSFRLLARRAVPVTALAALAVLAGCANLAPDYVRPAAPVPAGWQSAGAVTPAGNVAAPTPMPMATDWHDFFLEGRLRRVVELSLLNNRDLRVAALNIERAQAQYGILRAAALPTIEGSLAASRVRTPGSLTSSGVPGIASRYSADLALTSYELDLFGRVRNLSDAALQGYFQTAETRRSTQISLVASVANAWLQLAADKQRLQLARNTLDSQQKSYSVIDRAHALGAQSGLALAQAQSTVETARAEAAAYDSLVEQDVNALVLLVGSSVPDDLLPQGTLLAGGPAAQLLIPPADLPSSVLQQRPDVLAAENALIASNADIGAARAAFYPRITLTASTGSASSSLSGLFKVGTDDWTFAPSIRIPIFNGNANRANLRLAENQRDIQLAGYEKTLQTAFREVADALSARRTLAERLSAQQALVGATARSYELSDALFKSGGGTFLNVLDAQRSLYAVQQSLISLQLIEQSNRVTIYKVLGGGWTGSALEPVPVAAR